MPITPDKRAVRRRRRARLMGVLVSALAVGVVIQVARRTQAPAPASVGPVLVAPGTAATAVAGSLPVVSLTGPAGALGRRYGELLSAPVRQVAGPWLQGLLADAKLSRKEALARGEVYRGRFSQSALDFLDGLAETSGANRDDLLLLQCLPELVGLGPLAGFVALTPTTRSNEVLLGLNWDAPRTELLAGCVVLTAVDEEGARAYVGAGPAGLIAPLAALTEAGLGVALLPTAETPPAVEGVPLLDLLRRTLQQATTVDEARRLIEAADRSRPASLLVAQTTPRQDAGVIEWEPTRLGFRAPDNGRLVATNHLRSLVEPPLGPLDLGACPRFDALMAWLLDHTGQVTRDSATIGAARAAAETSRLTIELQPATSAVGLSVVAPAAEQPLVWWHWDSATGALRALEAASQP